MNLKNLPLWIKGGVIAMCIETLFLVPVLIPSPGLGFIGWILLIPQFPFAIRAILAGSTNDYNLIGYIQQYALYFLVGALISLLDEKLYNKKPTSNSI